MAICKLCGTRNDAFGCYERCTTDGPWHEWADEVGNDACLYCGHTYESHTGDKDSCNDIWCCCECSGPALHPNNDRCYCGEYRPMTEQLTDAIGMLQDRLAVRDWNLRERGKTVSKLLERIRELENDNQSKV